MKFDKKSNPQYRNLQKPSPKNKQILIKTSNPQVFKENTNPQKKQTQIRGKTARLATLGCFYYLLNLVYSTVNYTSATSYNCDVTKTSLNAQQ